MDKQEKIVCAAIKLIVGEREPAIKLTVTYDGYQETNKTGGIEVIRGFMTNKNRFVDQKEAWRIAKDADQVNPLLINLDFKGHPELQPEYLY